jgi:hypothetical protein
VSESACPPGDNDPSHAPLSLRRYEAPGAEVEQPSEPPENKPSASYGPLIAAYAAVAGVAAGLVRWRARPLPQPSAGDVVVIGAAVFRLSRLVTKDKVLQPVRRPFVEGSDPGAAGEVNSQPAGSGPRRALGELLTCPFCTSMWLATGAVTFYALSPRAARLVAAIPASVAVSDVAQYVLTVVRQAAERQPAVPSPAND